MKIYHEKGKLSKYKDKMYRLKKGASGNGIELKPIYKEINGLKHGIKTLVTPSQDIIQLCFQLVKRNKENLISRCGGAHFNPKTRKAEAGGSLSLRQVWSNHQKTERW